MQRARSIATEQANARVMYLPCVSINHIFVSYLLKLLHMCVFLYVFIICRCFVLNKMLNVVAIFSEIMVGTRRTFHTEVSLL